MRRSAALLTASTARPRRAALYVPASNARALARAPSLRADVVIIDLEDAVAPASKVAARINALSTLSVGARGRFHHTELLLRVNGVGTMWHDDDMRHVTEALASGTVELDGIVLPKVESIAQVLGAVAALQNNSGATPAATVALTTASAPAQVPLWAMIETARGVIRCADIAATGCIAGLIAGTSDLSVDLRCDGAASARLALLPSLGAIVLAARAAGIVALDGVHLTPEADASFDAVCAQGVVLGFDGKTVIHPSQIKGAHTAFAPSISAVANAQRTLAAWGEAQKRGDGVAVLDGRLVEVLHAREAAALLAQHDRIRAAEASL